MCPVPLAARTSVCLAVAAGHGALQAPGAVVVNPSHTPELESQGPHGGEQMLGGAGTRTSVHGTET